MNVTNKSKIEGKYVFLKIKGNLVAEQMYHATWDYEKQYWVFTDNNCVTFREWNGEPTHYKLING